MHFFKIFQHYLISEKLTWIFIGMESRILIKGGVVVNATGSEQADVLVEDRIIKQVGTDIQVPEGTRIIDATDKLVMPGNTFQLRKEH